VSNTVQNIQNAANGVHETIQKFLPAAGAVVNNEGAQKGMRPEQKAKFEFLFNMINQKYPELDYWLLQLAQAVKEAGL